MVDITYVTAGEWGPGQGTKLSAPQADDNMWALASAVVALQDHAGVGVGIASIEQINATQFMIYLTNGNGEGPFTLPTNPWNFTGPWLPDTPYLPNDVVTANGAVYLITLSFTSASAFSPSATDGDGHLLYNLLLSNPDTVLPAGGLTGYTLVKRSNANYDVAWGTNAIETLTDVSISESPPPSLYDILVYDAGIWTNVSIDTIASLLLNVENLANVESYAESSAGYYVLYGYSDGVGDVYWTSTPVDTFNNDLLLGYLADAEYLNYSITPATGQFLRYGSSFWEPENIQTTDINDTLTDLGSISGTATVDPSVGSLFMAEPSGDCTIGLASLTGTTGREIKIQIETSGSVPYNITFDDVSGFISQGVLSTGVLDSKRFVVSFVSDGTYMSETSRTSAM
jgi:hypothetical protein